MPSIGPRRMAALHALWRALSQGSRPGAPGFGERLRALPRLLRGAVSGAYPQLGWGRLTMFLLAIAYIVSPVDFVPELFIPLLGLGDDAAVALWLGGAFLVETERFIEWERQQPTVIEGDRKR
ncbi:YkvA family protein [Pseudonocardia sp. TRM90224]|uniref:YkvA family protein n=1 Tax=Pseudonocardia sp. TRM90224 TaxID=2812678 RepID=UPI001E50FBC2|nr:YkvA family protein [Pseudonocardia sp. TRM90224]